MNHLPQLVCFFFFFCISPSSTYTPQRLIDRLNNLLREFFPRPKQRKLHPLLNCLLLRSMPLNSPIPFHADTSHIHPNLNNSHTPATFNSLSSLLSTTPPLLPLQAPSKITPTCPLIFPIRCGTLSFGRGLSFIFLTSSNDEFHISADIHNFMRRVSLHELFQITPDSTNEHDDSLVLIEQRCPVLIYVIITQ